ncbi:MAG: hypothetical protein K1X89_02265 [Myxococcaceae bacterium]|nr:hypothetical protein [Myxococcaceae bacterium]
MSDWRPKVEAITDPVAAGRLEFRDRNGARGSFEVKVGTPRAFEEGYYCPLEVEGLFPGVRTIIGTNEVDSLMNAMALVRRYFDHKNGLSSDPLPKFE